MDRLVCPGRVLTLLRSSLHGAIPLGSSLHARSLQDPDLPGRLRDRDREALAAVVEAYLEQTLRAARGAELNQQQADEVVQNTSWSRPPRGPEDVLFAKEANREIGVGQIGILRTEMGYTSLRQRLCAARQSAGG